VIDLSAHFAQGGDGVAHQESNACSLAQLDQLAGKAIGIPGFVFGGVGGASQLGTNMGQGRLDSDGLISADELTLATKFTHLLGGGQRALELLG